MTPVEIISEAAIGRDWDADSPTLIVAALQDAGFVIVRKDDYLRKPLFNTRYNYGTEQRRTNQEADAFSEGATWMYDRIFKEGRWRE